MNTDSADPGAGESRRDEAARRHVRLSSDVAEEADFLAFESWVADPENRAAYQAQETLSLEIEDAASTLSREMEVAQSTRPWRLTRRIGSAGLALAAVATMAVFLLPRAPTERWTTFEAPTNAPRLVALDDGTRVHLNRGASIKVAIDGRSRRIDMAVGEASFEVVHDAGRTFSVAVGEDRIEDVGTVFNVLNTGARTTVTVREGAVAVTPRDGARDGIRVTAGEQFIHDKGSAPVVARRDNADAAFAWRSGHLIYNDAALALVVADLNRYFAKKVRIDGDDAAALRFSGVIVVDDEDRVLERLKGLLPIDVSASETEVVLRHKRK